MDKLWAPWRFKYIRGKKKKGCIFCAALKAKGAHQLIYKSRFSFIMLNAFPYNNGHVMASPARHVSRLLDLNDAELADLFRTVNKAQQIINRALKPDGYNIGVNIGIAAGAGYPGHLHIHVVPRWKGDSNFMPVVGQTKVISQSLAELEKLLKKYARAK